MFVRGNLEKQVLKLPEVVKLCKRCCYSNQRPRIIFNDEGICSGCLNSVYKNSINWDEREKELVELLDSYRKNDGSFDVIVPSSGGKDSGYVAHQLKYKYGMHPLTVTWSPLKYTEIGFQNLRSSIDAGFANLLFTPNGKLQRKLARLCFEELGDAFHVFVLGQISLPFHIAIKFGVKLIFYGENGEAEYSGDPKYFDKPYKPADEFVNHFFKGVSFDELLEYGINNKDYLKDIEINESDLIFYKPPTTEEMKKADIVGKHYFSYYKKWVPQENYYYVAENMGFKANPVRTEGTYSKYASLDDKIDGMHYYLRFIKFGLGRTMEDVAHEIRDGHLTRDEGIALMKKYEGEFPKKYFNEFLEYLSISEEHFWEVIDSWRLPHIWEKVDEEWKLKFNYE
jgi:N-acetyl sugar amidotransferase